MALKHHDEVAVHGTMHVPMEMLKGAAGFRMTHAPYTGAGPAVLALLALLGRQDAIFTGPLSVAQQIKAGKLRALARWGEMSLQSLPEVPALKQADCGVSFAQWSALFLPAGPSEAVVQKLRAAAKMAANDPQVVQTINRAGIVIEYLDGLEFQACRDADGMIMIEAVHRIGKVE